MLKNKLQAVVKHPVTGLVTIVALNVAAVVVSHAVTKRAFDELAKETES
jgi:hypothetical protein